MLGCLSILSLILLVSLWTTKSSFGSFSCHNLSLDLSLFSIFSLRALVLFIPISSLSFLSKEGTRRAPNKDRPKGAREKQRRQERRMMMMMKGLKGIPSRTIDHQ